MNADDVGFVLYFDAEHSNMCSYCLNNPTNDIDSNGFASYRTKSKNMNMLIDAIGKAIPNIYTDDIWHKEKNILKIGTGNLSLTISCGAAAQTNKNALFGAMFKKGTLEVSSFFRYKRIRRVCFFCRDKLAQRD